MAIEGLTGTSGRVTSEELEALTAEQKYRALHRTDPAAADTFWQRYQEYVSTVTEPEEAHVLGWWAHLEMDEIQNTLGKLGVL